jgi:hypothetical protein
MFRNAWAITFFQGTIVMSRVVILLILIVICLGCASSKSLKNNVENTGSSQTQISRTTELIYLEKVPSLSNCESIVINPNWQAWTLNVFKDGSGYLRLGSSTYGANYPRTTFNFSEIYYSIANLKPKDTQSKCYIIEFKLPYEYYSNPAIMWPRSQSLYVLLTADIQKVQEIYKTADNYCKQYWNGPSDKMEELCEIYPIFPSE